MTSYKPSGPGIVYQEIEGEVIVVDLQKGHYYSLTGTAVPIWSSLLRGCGVSGVVGEICSAYSGDPSEIETSVTELVDALEAEGLVARSDVPPAPPELLSPEAKIAFSPPLFQKYTDMEDVLVLDPIHDVDESGWPNVKKA